MRLRFNHSCDALALQSTKVFTKETKTTQVLGSFYTYSWLFWLGFLTISFSVLAKLGLVQTSRLGYCQEQIERSKPFIKHKMFRQSQIYLPCIELTCQAWNRLRLWQTGDLIMGFQNLFGRCKNKGSLSYHRIEWSETGLCFNNGFFYPSPALPLKWKGEKCEKWGEAIYWKLISLGLYPSPALPLKWKGEKVSK